jgi:aminoglycoside/choline kinase family phosphotransferase
VIAKFPTLDESARMNVVEPLRFYEKEVRFYQQAAPLSPLATPRAYFADHDPATGDFLLILEDLGERRTCDQTAGCEVRDAEVAIDALAGLHVAWWESTRFAGLPWLPFASDPPFPQVVAGMFKQAWPRAQEVLGERIPEEFRAYGERFPELVEWFFEQASRPPVTLLHGDFRLDNLFFGTGGGEPPVTAVDWQICIKGRGGYDLGYFLSQSLTPSTRREHEEALVRRYHEAVSRHVSYPFDELWDDYRRTVAFCFTYPVVAAGQIEVTNERHLELLTGMAERAMTAIADVRALALLPV